MNVQEIRIENYDYNLPDEKIALFPLNNRDECRLLVANPAGKISHRLFSDLPLLLSPDTLLVINETKVIRARLDFRKTSGASIEIFLLEPSSPHDYTENFASVSSCSWKCLIGNKKRWKEGILRKELKMKEGGEKVVLTARRLSSEFKADDIVEFSWDNEKFSFAEIIEEAGSMPIPPYLKRQSRDSDNEDYQTVFSRIEGSVAAPTAGLHFTPELMENVKKHGNEFASVTLHVGAGTFQPVKSDDIGGHLMHSEWISVSRRTLMKIITALENGRNILAVGTTTVRTLESLPYLGVLAEENRPLEVKQWMPYEQRFERIDTIRALKSLLRYLSGNNLESIETNTSIMIAPGFRWRIVNRLITNFHQPKSTLLLLVSSFLGKDEDGKEKWEKVYEKALKEGYRFLSYGDACLFARGEQSVELPLAKSMLLRGATLTAIYHPDKLAEMGKAGLCDDSEYYIRALQKVIESSREKQEAPVDIYIGEGAAPLRFLTAFAASLPGAKVRISCAPGLMRRPLAPLVDTLRKLGADIEFDSSPQAWKLLIYGRKIKGGEVEVDASVTSQFLSALLLASGLWENGIVIKAGVEGMVSRSYLKMTEAMIKDPDLKIESDWSAAAFFYEYVLISGRDSVTIKSLTPPAYSLQGDAVCCDIYDRIGVTTDFLKDGGARLKFDVQALELLTEAGGFEFDFTDSPDLVPSIAVALCFRKIPFRFRGVAHLRYKECDRLSALSSLLLRIGYGVEIVDDNLVFNGEFKPLEEFPVEIDPYGDHRMAMAFYPLELRGMVKIENKDVVSKSFPDFYQQF